MSALPDILLWDEEAPPNPVRGDWPMLYDGWEEKRLQKRDAAIAILRPSGEDPASNEAGAPDPTDQEDSESLIAEFWPS